MRALTQKKSRVLEFLLYALVSLAGFGVDFATLWLLTQQLHVHYAVAAISGFLLGALIVYYLSIRVVFGVRTSRSVAAESMSFIAIGVIGLLLNLGLITAAVQGFNANVMLAKGFASAVTLFVNFLLRRFALFSQHPQTLSAED